MAANDRHTTAFWVGAILGGAAGVAWGLLNAPGPQRREEVSIGRIAERAADWMVVAAADAEVAAREFLARAELRDTYRPPSDLLIGNMPLDAVDVVLEQRPTDGTA